VAGGWVAGGWRVVGGIGSKATLRF
jgi:hypothetical protein